MRYHIAIPKCGTNSYLHHLKNSYNIIEPDFIQKVGFVWKDLPQDNNNSILFAKHLPYIQDVELDNSIILRNPVERVWSHFCYYIKLKNHALSDVREMIYRYLQSEYPRYEFLMWFLAHPYTNELKNLMTRFVIGSPAGLINTWYSNNVINYNQSKLISSQHTIIELAKYNLDRIEKVMLLEDLDIPTRKNVNDNKEIMTKKERKLIERYNQLDLKLYQYAKEVIR